jgi:hypothetical protein
MYFKLGQIITYLADEMGALTHGILRHHATQLEFILTLVAWCRMMLCATPIIVLVNRPLHSHIGASKASFLKKKG